MLCQTILRWLFLSELVGSETRKQISKRCDYSWNETCLSLSVEVVFGKLGLDPKSSCVLQSSLLVELNRRALVNCWVSLWGGFLFGPNQIFSFPFLCLKPHFPFLFSNDWSGVMPTSEGFCFCKDHPKYSFCLPIVISLIPIFKCCGMLSTHLKIALSTMF